MTNVVSRLRRGLVVSCQAPEGSPLRSSMIMAAMALAAEQGGAAGIRAEGAEDIAAIAAVTELPIIGLRKERGRGLHRVFITASFADAEVVARAGAHIVAVDATLRDREGGEPVSELVARIHGELGMLVMADVDGVDAGLAAIEAGADLVSTTLSGYTGGPVPDGPDLALVAALAERGGAPVVAEGRLWTREDVLAAFNAGAYSVVVGSALTNPLAATRRIVSAISEATPLDRS